MNESQFYNSIGEFFLRIDGLQSLGTWLVGIAGIVFIILQNRILSGQSDILKQQNALLETQNQILSMQSESMMNQSELNTLLIEREQSVRDEEDTDLTLKMIGRGLLEKDEAIDNYERLVQKGHSVRWLRVRIEELLGNLDSVGSLALNNINTYEAERKRRNAIRVLEGRPTIRPKTGEE